MGDKGTFFSRKTLLSLHMYEDKVIYDMHTIMIPVPCEKHCLPGDLGSSLVMPQMPEDTIFKLDSLPYLGRFHIA